MGKYEADAKELLRLVGGKKQYRSSNTLYIKNAICTERSGESGC